MQADALTREDLVQAVIPNPAKIATSKAVYNELVRISANISCLSSDCATFSTRDWVESQGYLTSHQSIAHKLNTSTFANLSTSFLTAHQDLTVLNDYYKKSETSSAAQLVSAFSKYPDTLSINFNNFYNDAADKYVSAYTGIDISATYLSEANRINEIIIYTGMTGVEKITSELWSEDIGALSSRTKKICQYAGMPLEEVHLDTLEGIADALNTATEKLKVFGPGMSLMRILQVYLIRSRALEFKIAQLKSLIVEINGMKQTLREFAQSLKNTSLAEEPYVYDITDKLDAVISANNDAADILLNI